MVIFAKSIHYVAQENSLLSQSCQFFQKGKGRYQLAIHAWNQ
jgi:hypothetical protein